jgi:hypothetical protein
MNRNDQAHARETVVPRATTGSLPRDNSTIASRMTSAREPGTSHRRLNERPLRLLCAKRARCESPCNSDAFPTSFGTGAGVPRSAAGPTPHLLDAECGIRTPEGSPARFDGALRTKCSPECYAAHGCCHQSTSCGMRAGALMVFWRSRRWARG